MRLVFRNLGMRMGLCPTVKASRLGGRGTTKRRDIGAMTHAQGTSVSRCLYQFVNQRRVKTGLKGALSEG